MDSLFDRRYKKAYEETSGWMLDYDSYKEEFNNNLEQARMDIILSSPLFIGIVGGHNNRRQVADFTAKKAINLVLYSNDYMEKWLELCEDAENSFPDHLKVFLNLKRKYRNIPRNKSAISRIQADFPYALAKKKGLEQPDDNMWVESRKTFYEWWNRIVRVTMWEASRRNLFLQS